MNKKRPARIILMQGNATEVSLDYLKKYCKNNNQKRLIFIPFSNKCIQIISMGISTLYSIISKLS